MGLLSRSASTSRLRSVRTERNTARRRQTYEPTPSNGNLYSVARVQAPPDLRDTLPGANVLSRARVVAWPRTHARRNYALCVHDTDYGRLPVESTRCSAACSWATTFLLVGFEQGKGEPFERFSRETGRLQVGGAAEACGLWGLNGEAIASVPFRTFIFCLQCHLVTLTSDMKTL